MAKKKKKVARSVAALRRVRAWVRRGRLVHHVGRGLKKNPPKMRRVTKSTGWLKATAVKFVKRKGKPVEVLVRRPARRRRK